MVGLGNCPVQTHRCKVAPNTVRKTRDYSLRHLVVLVARFLCPLSLCLQPWKAVLFGHTDLHFHNLSYLNIFKYKCISKYLISFK